MCATAAREFASAEAAAAAGFFNAVVPLDFEVNAWVLGLCQASRQLRQDPQRASTTQPWACAPDCTYTCFAPTVRTKIINMQLLHILTGQRGDACSPGRGSAAPLPRSRDSCPCMGLWSTTLGPGLPRVRAATPAHHAAWPCRQRQDNAVRAAGCQVRVRHFKCSACVRSAAQSELRGQDMYTQRPVPLPCRPACRFGLPVVNAGDLLHAEVARKTPLGVEAQRHMHGSRTVPDRCGRGFDACRPGGDETGQGLDGCRPWKFKPTLA